MKLEIECKYKDFKVIVDWPEQPIGYLYYMAFTTPAEGRDPELNMLRLHHNSTKPKIGDREGLASGHEIYEFRTLDGKQSGIIEVTGTIAVVTKT